MSAYPVRTENYTPQCLRYAQNDRCEVNPLQLSVGRYTTLTVQGHPARKYDNRITRVQADLGDIYLSPWLDDKNM